MRRTTFLALLLPWLLAALTGSHYVAELGRVPSPPPQLSAPYSAPQPLDAAPTLPDVVDLLADVPVVDQLSIPEPAPEPAPEPEQTTDVVAEPWASLADCESGDWVDGGASFVAGSARWHSGHSDPARDERPSWSSGLFYGGLQFERESWDWASDVGGHGVAGSNPADHPPSVQVEVAETLRAIHPAGWGAWPRCSRLVGLR